MNSIMIIFSEVLFALLLLFFSLITLQDVHNFRNNVVHILKRIEVKILIISFYNCDNEHNFTNGVLLLIRS